MNIISNPILIDDYGKYGNIKGVMESLVDKVIELLLNKGSDFLDKIDISYVINNPNTRGHTEEYIDIRNFDNIKNDIAEIQTKVKEILSDNENVLKSYYVKILSKKVDNGKFSPVKIFRIADHYHGKRNNKEMRNADKNKRLLVRNNNGNNIPILFDLNANNFEEIDESINEAINELNLYLDRSYSALVSSSTNMINDIEKLLHKRK